jgi:hypothetical protein
MNTICYLENNMNYDNKQLLKPQDALSWVPENSKSISLVNYLYSMLFVILIDIVFLIISVECRNWAMIPLSLCGILSGSEVIAWLRKEIDTFDPKITIFVIFFLNTYLSPLIHLNTNMYGKDISVPDWSYYFAKMAIYNAIGLVLFKMGHATLFQITKPTQKTRIIEPRTFYPLLVLFVGVGVISNVIVRLFYSGLVKEGGEFTVASIASMKYLSGLLMLGDPVPLLILIGVVLWIVLNKGYLKSSLFTVLIILAILAIFQFIWVGLRGSRSAILYGVFIGAAIVHHRLRPFSLTTVIIGITILLVFVHLYDYRKKFGQRGWAAFYSSDVRSQLDFEGGERTIVGTLLGDITRSDIQAYLLYQIETKENFQPLHGQTYAMSVLTFVPRFIWPNKPLSLKLEAGTALQGYSGSKVSSRVYGLVGEGILNFGKYGILPPFLIFGAFVGFCRKKISTMNPVDARFFLLPLLYVFFTLAVCGDSDNIVFGLLKGG